MALSDKDIIITPNRGQSADPKIEFRAADASVSTQTISLNVYPISSGTVSFEGSAGQLFSISNDLSGTIFSVNDVSGIPSIEVDDDGTIRLAQYSGNVLIGTASDNGVDKLQVNGSISVNGQKVVPLGIQEFSATAGQTTFTISGGYTVGTVQVFANGINLGNGAFVATNGTSVVLNNARQAGDIIRIISGGASSQANSIQTYSLAMSVALGT